MFLDILMIIIVLLKILNNFNFVVMNLHICIDFYQPGL